MVHARALTSDEVSGIFEAGRAGICRSECTCSGDVVDTFADGVLAPYWIQSRGCATPREADGALILSRPDGCTELSWVLMDQSQATLCGDFDVSVDFALIDLPAPASGVLVTSFEIIHLVSGPAAVIERYHGSVLDCNPATQCFKAFTSTSLNCDPTVRWAPALGDAGGFRIARVGTTVSMYYRTDGDWIELLSAPVTDEEVRLRLRASHAGPAISDGFEVRYDDLRIVSTGCAGGSVQGTLTADCPASGTPLHGVVVDAFKVGTGTLAASDTTALDGSYSLTGLEEGEYDVTVVTPMGYAADSADVRLYVEQAEESALDLVLRCIPVSEAPQSFAFWKHQFGVATRGRGQAVHDPDQLCAILDVVEAHFNSNGVNAVVVYAPPPSGLCADKLTVATDLLYLQGANGFYSKAQRELLALLLNVAGQYISQNESISVDGRSASQAITFCDRLLDDPTGDWQLAWDIARRVNQGQIVLAGIIPDSVPNIAYRSDPPALEMAGGLTVRPNPARQTTNISFSLPAGEAYTVELFDVGGRCVKRMAGVGAAGGRATVTWDGRDGNGTPLTSGIFLCRVEAGGEKFIDRVVLLSR